ncbi:hypothetical protein XI03_21115 [Bradyrhizobium sp. CCBAU 65884]|nr:hypothetical protein [Bradyrhizobium sp. CCBAU 65884]
MRKNVPRRLQRLLRAVIFNRSDETAPAATAERICTRCGRKFELVRPVLNPGDGRTVLMYECRCGEPTWSE